MKYRFRIYLVLTLCYAAFIFYLSSRPNLGDPSSIFHLFEPFLRPLEKSDFKFLLYPLYIIALYPDKVAHMVIYAGFGVLLYFTLKNSQYMRLKDHAFIFAILIGTAYGASDEFHQYFVPGRSMSIWDLLADSIGLALAQAVVYFNGNLPGKKTKISTFDLKIVLILILLSILFVLVHPFNQTFLRIILALPLLLFLPGYLFITVMFPKKGELSPIERFTLSIGLSIAITVFDGFALNYTPWGFRPNSIVMSLSLIILALLTTAYLQRKRLGELAYEFSIEHIRYFFRTLTSKETETGPEYDPALEKMLIKTMIIAILLVSAMLVYAKVTTEPEKFTALYILGENGKAENYLTDIRIGETSTIQTGVENYEHATVNYTLRVNLGGRTLREQEIILDHNSKWQKNITFVPQLTASLAFAGANRSKLEFQLLKENRTYRSVHLLVNVSLDSVKFATMPNMTNGDMESDASWLFSRNSENITGRYEDSSGSSLSRTFEINFTSEKAGTYGILYQNLTTSGDALAYLSFDVKDSDNNTNSSKYVFKQALIDDQIVWENGAGGNNRNWSHVETPVLLSGNNTIAFRIYSKYDVNYNETFWWDNIKLKPYGILFETGDTYKNSDMDVKFSGFFSADNLSIIKLSVENTGKNVSSFDLRPAPVMIDDLGNKYGMVRTERGSQISQNSIYPGVVRKGNIFFKPVNSSADKINLTLYINNKMYKFSFKNEPNIQDEIKEADIGETISNSGFEVGLYGYQNIQTWYSNVIVAVKNTDQEEKTFKLSPLPILTDDLGNQYDMLRVQRGSEIKQTTIYPGVIRRGSIYFGEIKPEARNLKLILYLNGEKYFFSFKAEQILLNEEASFRNTAIRFPVSAAIGETIYQGGYNLSLRGYQNTQDWASKVTIAVKNTEQEDKPFKLTPAPVLIDDLGNQYEVVNIGGGNQIKQTAIYPGVIRKGDLFFEPINLSAQHLWLIMYLNGERCIFSFKDEPKSFEDENIPVDTSRIISNATMGEALSMGGFEVRLKGFQNTQDWTSKVMISVRNLDNENKLLKINTTTVLLDDLGNQYEMVNVNRAGQIEQTTIMPLAQKEGNIFFEPVKNEAKYLRLILRISTGRYEFGFKPGFNATYSKSS